MNVEILRILYFIFCLPLLARTRCGNLEIFFWVKILEILQIGAIFFYKNPFYVSKSYFSGLKKGEICGDTKKKKKKKKKKKPIGTLWVCILRIIYLLP